MNESCILRTSECITITPAPDDIIGGNIMAADGMLPMHVNFLTI